MGHMRTYSTVQYISTYPGIQHDRDMWVYLRTYGTNEGVQNHKEIWGRACSSIQVYRDIWVIPYHRDVCGHTVAYRATGVHAGIHGHFMHIQAIMAMEYTEAVMVMHRGPQGHMVANSGRKKDS